MPQDITEQLSREQQISALEKDWATNPRWKGIKRGYSAADVVRLRGSFPIEYTLSRRRRRRGERSWSRLLRLDSSGITLFTKQPNGGGGKLFGFFNSMTTPSVGL